mgnify:CR=1 FL=1
MSNIILNSDVKIMKSVINGAGKGVFATNFIKKGTYITEYSGKFISQKQVDILEKNKDTEYLYYTINLSNNKLLLGDMNSTNKEKCGQLLNDVKTLKNPKKLILNNAKEYIKSVELVNCEFIEKNNKMYIVSIRHIEKGEELYVHYGYSYWFRPEYKKSTRLKKLENEWDKHKFILDMDQKYMDIIYESY